MASTIDKLAWLHIENDKLLVVRSKGKALFYLPGGKREFGESDQQALLREIKEEISVDLEADTLTFAHTFTTQADGKSVDTLVKLSCYFVDYRGKLAPDAEIEELKFITYRERNCCSLATVIAIE